MKTIDQVVFISHTMHYYNSIQLFETTLPTSTDNTNSNHVWSELYGIVFVRVCG